MISRRGFGKLTVADEEIDRGFEVARALWGEGNTPIREVLQLLKKERWPIRAYIEYEYRGAGSPIDEVTKCVAFVKDALG